MLVAMRGDDSQRPSGDRRLTVDRVDLCNGARRRLNHSSTTMPQPSSQSSGTPTVTPNLYQLSGQHLHLTYSPSSIAGKPTLTYQDSHQSKSFKGDEIRTVECDLGLLISVTLRMTVDVGSTTLSLVIPHMRISPVSVAAVHTECITTVHHTPFAPQVQGQAETYTVTSLHGTAQAVSY
jgi:hypothetical protein